MIRIFEQIFFYGGGDIGEGEMPVFRGLLYERGVNLQHVRNFIFAAESQTGDAKKGISFINDIE